MPILATSLPQFLFSNPWLKTTAESQTSPMFSFFFNAHFLFGWDRTLNRLGVKAVDRLTSFNVAFYTHWDLLPANIRWRVASTPLYIQLPVVFFPFVMLLSKIFPDILVDVICLFTLVACSSKLNNANG